MRVALKLVLATVLGTLMVLVIFGWVRAHNEVELFDSDMRGDHLLVGTTLAVCVSDEWLNVGRDRALQLVKQANAERPHMRLGFVHPDGTQSAEAPGRAMDHQVVDHLEHFLTTVADEPGQEFLVTRVPVHGANGEVLGAVEIAERMEVRRDYIRSNVLSTLAATLAMVGFSGVVVLVMGVWLVGRPLSLLAAKAQRIGQGDLTGPLSFQQRDEIGELGHEVNAMCERLSEANARSQAETTARIDAIEQLRHADRLITVGRLAAGIAHELGTPLNVIAGRVKMLRRGNVEGEARAEYLAAVAEQAERMTTIIRQLLDFAGRREPRPTATDLHAIARAIARLVEPIARKHQVEVQVAPQGDAMAVGDPVQLEQVLSNLVVNAIHACQTGGKVEIACGTEPASSEGRPGAKRAYLRVTDDGHGMDESTKARIFEPFFTTKDIGQGTGLGLSVAHGIVLENGGSISVTSQVGQGSSFAVFLPAVSA
ncbi:MAG TPA: HAMP domain-containing sensor histidine kinase [Polyangiaceae bacterium]|nr:HAMP domain-containing sensor histidine kinase [Polyangiaceae bacterium]